MHRLACWRWFLPFAQLCLMLVCLKWIENQKFPPAIHTDPAILPQAEGAQQAAGWEVRSCWGCDSVGPGLALLFLITVGASHRAGAQLDCRLTAGGHATLLPRILPAVLAGVSCTVALAYTCTATAFALLLIAIAAVFFSVVFQLARQIARACGASPRLRSRILAIAAVISIATSTSIVLMAPHRDVAILVAASCLLVFGVFCWCRPSLSPAGSH
ncbi:MAG: hypothetical protein ACRD8O_09505 [Bryobacteraceae bacterium]